MRRFKEFYESFISLSLFYHSELKREAPVANYRLEVRSCENTTARRDMGTHAQKNIFGTSVKQ
jgi:hypothetical protein